MANHFRETFRSLAGRNYRLYYIGQVTSMAGTWMQSLAVAWLVWRLTHSSWLLGVVAFAGQAPVLAFGVLGGFLADHFNRQKILICTQSLFMIQAALLALLTLSGQIQVWQIIVLSLLMGIISAFDLPCRQAFVVNLVGKEDLVNAIGLNSSLFHGSRIIGPAIAGILVNVVGEGICFVVNALSFLALLAALLLMRDLIQTHVNSKEMKLAQVGEAFHFAWRHKDIRAMLILVALTCFFAMQYIPLLPVVVSEVLHMQAFALGLLTASAAIGAVIAALAVARFAKKEMLFQMAGWANLCSGVALVAFSQVHNLALSVIIIMLVGFTGAVAGSACNSFLQLTVADHLRGLLMSIFTTIVMGSAALGSLCAGFAAHKWGVPITLLACGLCCVACAAAYLIGAREVKETVYRSS